ncbi:MAG: hypothetical protein IJG68_00720 [Bacilli bacterium]|nr:hypothetical protein [Bacilli bacterium]
MRKNNKQMTTYFILFSLLLIGVVYAILQANLQINGTAKIKKNTWDIHFDNIQVNENSVSIGTGDSGAEIDSENNCKIDFEVTLSLPGDFYEFTVDVVNAGTIDGMIGELNKILKVNNEVVSEIPGYLDYSVTYADGMEIQANHKLEVGVTETYKVKLVFKTDIEELPEAATISTSLETQYLQADSSSVYRADASFATDSWSEIVSTYNTGNLTKLNQAMEEGTTKEVPLDLDNDGIAEKTAHVRIANLSIPSECETTGFSQTACGFVIEFVEVIDTHRMNPYDQDIISNGNGSKGGWEYSDMRSYLNSTKYLEGEIDEIDYTSSGIYNALPSDLKNKIINTTTVSGYGYYDSENFTTIDKLYLLSTKEVFGKEGTSGVINRDTAEIETRQLDYYLLKNVTTSSYSGAIKKNLSGAYYYWWLRSAEARYTTTFYSMSQTWGEQQVKA